MNYKDLIIRYLILIAVAISNLWLFYIILTPITVYSTYFLFEIFFDASISGTTIFIGDCPIIELVQSCIAGSAYYLLLILNLSIPNIKPNKRIKMIALAFTSLLIINLLRIFILGTMAIYELPSFDITHKFFWYFLSTIFVVTIWFAEVKYFKIKQIPFYSDLKFLYNKSNLKK